MGNNTICNFELLGRVLDGRATDRDRKIVLRGLTDSVFEECILVALKASVLYNENGKVYETVQ
ncbi:hypothetical protein B5G10_03415 [Barnesiella sp. An55]|nr:hypothetical protein B5G10_03415 [Barnesiella sp. An55]